jgi:hypothetical protein
MAVPWINFLAPSMGGIGPIELRDLGRLNKLKAKTGVPFYAGRFYPKDSDSILNGLRLGLISETPPWLTWEEIRPTQIWMVPVFEDERIISTLTTIERIDIWPREEGDNLPELELTEFDEYQLNALNFARSFNPNIDPGIEVTQNLLPPVFAAGYVGISEIKGRVTEWGFYDQGFTFINKKEYGDPPAAVPNYYGADASNPVFESDDYSEIVKVRMGDAFYDRNPVLEPGKYPEYPINKSTGRYDGMTRYIRDPSYSDWAIYDKEIAETYGSIGWNRVTRPRGSKPSVGSFMEIKTSSLDTMVITIKTSCITVVIPDGPPLPGSVAELGQLALETLGSNITNNVWYFYLPVRYDGRIPAKRIEFLLNRAGINKIDNPNHQFQ